MMDIRFDELTLEAGGRFMSKKKCTLLKSISGQFKAGELSAILGSSGAGKTSLLNALSGYRSRLYSRTGEVTINGEPFDRNSCGKYSCYITQENLLVPYLTLDETMMFAALLKLPSSSTKKQKKFVVEKVQTMFGLVECKNTRTELLSGGEKKRLSIALELINNPPILFLDEPTSGLDNVASSNLIELLRNLAHQGRTIVCTIHQPSASIFALFDSAYVLALGQCIYQGATQEIVPFLESSLNIICPTHYNPADYVIEVAEDEGYVNTLSKAINNGKLSKSKRSKLKLDSVNQDRITGDTSPLNGASQSTSDAITTDVFNYGYAYDNLKKESLTHNTVGFWTQFYVLLSRMLLQIRRNKVALRILTFTNVFIGAIGSMLFYKLGDDGNEIFSQVKVCVALTTFYAYTYCLIPVLAYPFEVKVLKKEHFNRWYRLGPYYLASTFSSLPGLIIFNFVFLAIWYPSSGLPLEAKRFLVLYLIGLIVSNIAEATGRTIGSIFNVTNASVVGPLVLSILIGSAVYGVDFARKLSVYVQLMLNLSFIRTGFMAHILGMFGMDRGMLKCSNPAEFCAYANPKISLYYLNLENKTVWDSITGLLISLVAFRICLYVALKWRLSK